MKFGNLCIAGHNYHDDRFFSKLYQLNLGDSINIYDSNGNVLEYIVDNKYTISSTDSNCTSQSTNGQKQITLLTCNNMGKNRLIIKATSKV